MTKRELAHSYLTAGLSIIPLWPKSKVAMVQWTQFQARHPTKEEVDGWWASEPEANIGIITGAISGIVVCDVDPRHGGSVEEVERLCPSGYVVRTPGGGAHFYYRHPGGRVQKGKPRPGIDRQSDGCYVVAASSYVKTEAYEGPYTAQENEQLPIPLPPDWFLADPEPASTTPPSATDAWVSNVLERGCPAGTRNDTLARLAGYFAGKRVPIDIATGLLTPWVLKQAGTGVTADEAARTIQSIYAKERRWTPAATEDTYVVDEFDATKQENRVLDTMLLSDFGVQYYDEKVDWLVPEWLPARTIAFIVSPPGRFKTMLSFDLAISVAGGWPFLGRVPVQNPGPVLVIQQEDDYGDMARRFSRIFSARQPGRIVPAAEEGIIVGHMAVSDLPPVHICTTRGFTLNSANLRQLEDVIRRIRPRVVIIDPLYSITSAEDFMMSAAHDMMPLKRLRDAYDTAFILAAHTKKAAGIEREGLWGSQFLNAFLETGWQIRDVPEGEPNQIQVLRHFKSSGETPLLNLEFLLNDDEGYRVEVSDPAEGEVCDVVLRELARFPDQTASVPDLVERCGLKERTVQRRLLRLRDSGHVVAEKSGKNKNVWKIPLDRAKELE